MSRHNKGGYKMRKRTGFMALAFLLALASAYGQTTDFLELVKTGTPQQIQVAIKQGVDLNAQDGLGVTALMFAARHNQDPEVITTLLEAGADLKAQSKAGVTALMFAAQFNSTNVITTLLKAGADFNTQSK